MKHMKHSFLWGFLLFASTATVGSHNILFFHDIGTRSHLHVYFPLVEELLNRGHKVTAAYYASAKISHENYTEILLQDIQGNCMKKLSTVYLEEGAGKKNLMNPALFMRYLDILPEFANGMTENFLNKQFQAVLKQKFDVVITTSSQAGYVATVLDCPIIFISPPGPFHIWTHILGNVFDPASSPVMGTTMTDPAQFSQRLNNFFAFHAFNLWVLFAEKMFLNDVYTRLNYTGPGKWESLSQRSQIMLSNSHAVTHEPQQLLENVVHVGGIHIKPPNPLPQDLQDFLDASPQGVVFVSFGSSITSSSMSDEKKKVFLKVFELLKMPVIWKFDKEIAVPANVMVKNWLPQQDLLAHPNLKVFVTHGGLLSVMEAIYHETILVGIPLANDQRPNLVRLQSKNIGIMLDYDELEVESFLAAIQKALTDRSMAESMRRMSQLFKDAKETPLERAVWWVEFVLRNNGAELFKPKSMNLNFYQARNLDILVLAVLGGALWLYLSYQIIRLMLYCCSYCRGGKKIKSA